MAADDESAGERPAPGDIIEPDIIEPDIIEPDIIEPDIIEHGAGSSFGALGWLSFQGKDAPGPGWRPSRAAAVLAAVALLTGLAAGYAAGKGTSGTAPAPRITVTSAPSPGSPSTGPAPVNPLADVGPAVGQALASCSVQAGTELQLGIEVTNQSGTAVTLTDVRPVFPLKGGLRAVSSQWAPCNTYGASQSTTPLAPGSSAWLSVTVKVLVSCPAAYPVKFDVTYVTGHLSATTTLSGFSDLGSVNYSGCSPSGSAGSHSSTFSAIFLGPAETVHTLKRRLHRVFG